MKQHPSQAPAVDSDPHTAPVPKPGRRVVRRRAALFICFIWNFPIAVAICLLVAGTISGRVMMLLVAGWAAVLPVGTLLLAYVPPFQRLLFESTTDVKSLRPKLWAFAVFWSVLVAIGVISEWASG